MLTNPTPNPPVKQVYTERLFATPVLVKDVDLDRQRAITAEIDLKLAAIRTGGPTFKPYPNDSVETTFCFGQQDVAYHDLRNLYEALNEAMVDYLVDLEYQDPQSGFRVTESWFNFYRKGGLAQQHSHIGRRLHAIYFYKTTGEDGDLELMNPVPFGHYAHFPYDSPIPLHHTVKPKVGRIVIMPAWMEHRVSANMTDSERITVCFNLA